MLSFSTLLPLAMQTLPQPRETFRHLLDQPVPREVLWQCLLLVVILSAVLFEVTNLVAGPGPEVAPVPALFTSPMLFGTVQMALLVVMVFAIHFVGSAMGGQGGFRGGILLVVWLQFVMVCLQVVQTLALLLLPPLAQIIGIAGLVLFLWLLTNFIAELHGFARLGRVFAMILFTMLGFALGLSLILTLIGVSVPR